MKTGKTLIELATEVTRRAEAKSDLVVNTKHIEMAVAEAPRLIVGGDRNFGINTIAHDQIGQHLEIPR